MRVALIGAGALGGVIGFYLSTVADVVLVDPWAEHVAAIAAHGLRCERDGVETIRRVHAVSDPALAGRVEAALVLVKSRQTPWAAEAARTALTDTGVAYTLQNGLGNREILAEALGEERAGQGVTSLGGTLLGPGRVRHAGMGPTLFGAAPDRTMAGALADLFSQAGLPAEVREDVTGLVWGKLIVNAGINALTALLRVPNGALVETSAARELLAAAAREAADVAAALGVRLPYADPVEHALEVARATAANRSSTLQDVLRGAPTEIGAINGAVAREGARLGVPTPVNALLASLIEALEATTGQRVGEG
ncbi:MAG: 2-dehydropantoate 2-reductase [Oscillochloridaceae bacterium]|nr:2-dehydropantoate 2-reductase [Chloroflexaceae bacterium]MDW8390743.1 2-dehydropantoate 2-reductase [Oscillochloridaceae bacterium]